MRRFLLLFLIPILAFAEDSAKEFASLEGGPSSYIEDCVSAITGDFVFDQHDTVVKGAQPFPFLRRYVSREVESFSCCWVPFPHLIGVHIGQTKCFRVLEPNMLQIEYLPTKKQGGLRHYYPNFLQSKKGITSRAHLGARHYDPFKNHITRKKGAFTLHLQNGTKRFYQKYEVRKAPNTGFFGPINLKDQR